MSTWKWRTSPMGYGEKCASCKVLMLHGDLVVTWTDSQNYHVGCLLDDLAKPRVLAVKAGEAVEVYGGGGGGGSGLPHWGMLGGGHSP